MYRFFMEYKLACSFSQSKFLTLKNLVMIMVSCIQSHQHRYAQSSLEINTCGVPSHIIN